VLVQKILYFPPVNAQDRSDTYTLPASKVGLMLRNSAKSASHFHHSIGNHLSAKSARKLIHWSSELMAEPIILLIMRDLREIFSL
jgi:hypothetical protein